jgi:hypothetical protein
MPGRYRSAVSYDQAIARGDRNETKETTMLKELNSRAGDGITVTLYWDSTFDRTMIRLTDDRTETDETFQVPTFAAADAFEHPFFYYLGSRALPEPVELVAA